MDFFEAQERARVTSRWLVVWFLSGMAGVLASLYLLAMVVKVWWFSPSAGGGPATWHWIDGQVAAWTLPTVGSIILLGSMFKLMQLSAGGAVVARDLGGRQVDHSTRDFNERRLVNVVEEMAIASGLPVPEIWIMDREDGINAFAAGTDPANAVIGVTRGTLERLNREELQGVVAHEFSHILNGDMKLNMRLTGWIFGLVMIAMIGRGVLHLLRYMRSSGGNSKNGGGIALLVLVVGASLWAIGSVGALFSRLLQAAVSRQREFLADASAVQFTRNPMGIANALKKIGGFWRNGGIQAAGAAEARHLFFASSDLLRFGLATHPPLEQRIRALDPTWQGEMIRGDQASAGNPPPLPAGAPVSGFAGAASLAAAGEGSGAVEVDPRVGASLLHDLGQAGIAFHSKDDAKAMLRGILLGRNGQGGGPALELLSARSADEAAGAVGWAGILGERGGTDKIALVDLALPWLRRMSADEAREFITLNHEMIAADGEIDLFEFMLERVIERHVSIGLGLRVPVRIRYRGLDELAEDVGLLLGAFAGQAGDPAAVEPALAEYTLHTGQVLRMPPAEKCTLDLVAAALGRIEMSTPLVKSRVLRLCGMVVMDDGALHEGEAVLLRAVADAIGAPMPPLVRLAG